MNHIVQKMAFPVVAVAAATVSSANVVASKRPQALVVAERQTTELPKRVADKGIITSESSPNNYKTVVVSRCEQWSKEMETRLKSLIKKNALSPIQGAEQAELRSLQARRRAFHDRRSADEIIAENQLQDYNDQLIQILNSLSKYVRPS